MGKYGYATKGPLQRARCFGLFFLTLLATTACADDTVIVQADIQPDTQVPQDVSGTELTGTDAATTDVVAVAVAQNPRKSGEYRTHRCLRSAALRSARSLASLCR